MENCFDFSTERLKAQCPIWNVAAVGKVMLFDLALLEVRFFIWTLRPHIKNEKKKGTSFKSRSNIVVTALGISRA